MPGSATLSWPAVAHAQQVAESKSENIGPWEIEATFKGDKFDRCSISRTLQDEVEVTFVRNGDGLTFSLESPNWKLDRGKSYPVKMTLGAQSWDTEVAAESNSVSVAVVDKKFDNGLRGANALNIVAAGATIRCRSTRVRWRLTGLSNAWLRITRRSKPTLSWNRPASRKGEGADEKQRRALVQP